MPPAPITTAWPREAIIITPTKGVRVERVAFEKNAPLFVTLRVSWSALLNAGFAVT